MSAVRFRPPAPFRDLEELEVAASRIYGVPVAALDHLIRDPEDPGGTDARRELDSLLALRRLTQR